MQMTVTLTKKEVDDILRQYVETKTGNKMKEAKAKVRMELANRPGCGSGSPVLDGYDLVMDVQELTAEHYFNK